MIKLAKSRLLKNKEILKKARLIKKHRQGYNIFIIYY